MIISARRTGLGVLVVLLSAASGPDAWATGPGGDGPPAAEDICEPLRADGVTRGLYGLCVSFCEAQDWGTDCRRDPYACGPSALRLLERYEAKRGPADPPMPCSQPGLGSGATCEAMDFTPGVVSCILPATANVFNIDEIVATLADQGVDDHDPLWIQVWAADGGSANDGKTGGLGGYAQLTSTAANLRGRYGTSVFTYLFGDRGTSAACAGGTGGVASLVTVQNLFQGDTPDINLALALAGGGGGAGGKISDVEDDCMAPLTFSTITGHNGGAGGVAISKFDGSSPSQPVSAPGLTPGGGSRSGKGGIAGVGGTGGHAAGTNGMGGWGGAGGSGRATPSSYKKMPNKFKNVDDDFPLLTGQGAEGASTSDYSTMGGGGGGGGWGGGGSGMRGIAVGESGSTERDTGAGGGGGSFVVASDAMSLLAPVAGNGRPPNPTEDGQSGQIRISFDISPPNDCPCFSELLLNRLADGGVVAVSCENTNPAPADVGRTSIEFNNGNQFFTEATGTGFACFAIQGATTGLQITADEANACRAAIVQSVPWVVDGCPK